MASTGNSTTNSDWIELPPSSDQVYNPNLQATSSSQSCSGGAGVKDQEHNSSWGLWNLVQKPLGWVTSGDTSSVDRKDDSVDSVKGASNMAASVPSDQKKGISALIKKAGGAVKKIVRSDDQWEHLDCDKEVKVEKPAEKEEDVFNIVLRDKMELQTKNTQLLKKIAELERKVKEGESQIAKKERELQHLQRLGQRDKPHAFQRQNSYEKAITSSQVSESNKDQEIRSLKRQVDTLKWKDQQHVFEVSKYDEEVRQLKESVERLQSQKLAAETDIANASKQAKYFEIQYCTEREHSQRLHDEIKQLQQQLDIAPLSELDDKSSSGEENSAKVIARLQNRIKLLNDNVSKLQEHSVEQSRAVLSLRQQAEVSQHMEEQVQSLEGLLEDAERERDHLRKLLSERNAHVEGHRGTGQDGLPSVTDIQARLTDKEYQLRTLAEENQVLKEKLAQSEAQAVVYKADFEEERGDRARIHGLIDDLKKKTRQAEGHAAEERAAYEQRLNEIGGDLRHTRELLHKHKVLLADAEKINQTRVQEAKDKAETAIKEADKYYQESEKFRQSTEYWRHQAEVNQRNLQAKASQVKQYAKEVEKVKEKMSVSEQNNKILMDALDKIAKEKDHLKKQNDQLAKQNERLKKKRKGSTDKLLASPDPPPEEDSTSIGIEYAYQRADDADKRADVATAKATEAERRAKEAEKEARAVGLKHREAESRAATMEKQLNEKMIEVQRLNYENEQLCLRLNQLNPNSTTQPANVTWPFTEDSKTAGSGSFAHAQPLRASLPEEPSPQDERNPSVATPTTGKPAPPSGLHLQSTATRPHSQRIAVSPLTPSSGHSTPTSGHSMDNHLVSGTTSKSSASQHTQEKTNLGEPVEQSTGHSTHSERVIGAKDALQLHNQRRPISFPLNAPSSNISTNAATAGQLSRRPLHESQPQLGPNQSHPSILPPRDSSEIISPTKGSPQPLPRQGAQREQLSPSNPPSQSGPPAINDTSSESEGDSQPGDDDEYGNQLQKGVDDDIHKQAAAVIKQVSGGRHQIKTDIQRPYDPNLICPMCMKKFRIGEIQKFKRHVNTCDGTDDDAGVGAIADDSDLV